MITKLAVSKKFAKALERARVIHCDDMRRGTAVPYLAHLLGVCALVWNDGGTEEEAIAALLHDAVEDHADQISFAQIEKEFGAVVGRIVEACTEPPAPGAAWREVKAGYIAHIRKAPALARRVILADKLDNARALVAGLAQWGEAYWSRFRSPTKEELLEYHHALKAALGDWPRSPTHAEFDRLVASLPER